MTYTSEEFHFSGYDMNNSGDVDKDIPTFAMTSSPDDKGIFQHNQLRSRYSNAQEEFTQALQNYDHAHDRVYDDPNLPARIDKINKLNF